MNRSWLVYRGEENQHWFTFSVSAESRTPLPLVFLAKFDLDPEVPPLDIVYNHKIERSKS